MAIGEGPHIDLPFGAKGEPGLVLYDGVCVLCSGWFRFVADRDAERRFVFTAIQSATGRSLAQHLGIDPDDPDTNAVLLDGKVYTRSDSALAVLANLPGWRWMAVFRAAPPPVRDCFYRIIARNRYRWFGRHATCDLGGVRYADRIIS